MDVCGSVVTEAKMKEKYGELCAAYGKLYIPKPSFEEFRDGNYYHYCRDRYSEKDLPLFLPSGPRLVTQPVKRSNTWGAETRPRSPSTGWG